jgi:glycine/D-amino acid oxidase-like deaminating enzyme
MDSDFIIIGAGPAGEAAAFKARERGASVAVIDRRWFGGSCPHIGCLPSKALLYAAEQHHANPDTYSWDRASKHRDYMVNRPPDAAEPDDTSHYRRLVDAGAVCYRGTARIVGHGRVEVRELVSRRPDHGDDAIGSVAEGELREDRLTDRRQANRPRQHPDDVPRLVSSDEPVADVGLDDLDAGVQGAAQLTHAVDDRQPGRLALAPVAQSDGGLDARVREACDRAGQRHRPMMRA